MPVANCSGVLAPWTSNTRGVIGCMSTASVGAFGDSILTAIQPRLRNAVSVAGHTTAVDFWSGSPSARAADAVEALPLADMPKVILIVAGSNDIFAPDAILTQASRIKAKCAQAGSVLRWMDVQVRRKAQPATVQFCDQTNSGLVNMRLREVLQPEQIIQYARYFAGAEFRIPEYLKDGVHPWESEIDGHSDGIAFILSIVMGSLTPVLDGLS